MRFIVGVILFLPLFCSQTVLSEPTPTIKYLMNEPVSMLDWGIYNMAQRLRPLQEHKDVGDVSVDYVWKKNRILITAHYKYDARSKSEKESKRRCEELVNSIKRHFRVDPKTGKGVLLDRRSSLGFLFGHAGYRGSNQPKNLYQELEKLVHIEVWNNWEGTAGSSGNVVCTSPLMGTQVYFRKPSIPSET